MTRGLMLEASEIVHRYGPVLALDSRPLALAIAEEWQLAGGEKGGTLQAEDVPLTRIAGTAQERVAPDPGPTVDALARYAESDLLCYRAERPDALVTRKDPLEYRRKLRFHLQAESWHAYGV